MSRPTPKSTYAPDPNLWINTAPSAKPRNKKLTQRPLVSFNHGIATPLSSGYKQPTNNTGTSSQRITDNGGPGPSSSINIRKRLNDQNYTPLPNKNIHKQGTLNHYLNNTPSTGQTSLLHRNKGKDRENYNENDDIRTPLISKSGPLPIPPPSSCSKLPTNHGLIFGNAGKRKDTLKGSRLKVYQDDFWGSGDEQDEEEEEKYRSKRVEKKHMEQEEQICMEENLQEKEPSISQMKKGKNKINSQRRNSISPNKSKNSHPPLSLPPPAQSTRSHDQAMHKSPSPSPINKPLSPIHHQSPYSSPSLPHRPPTPPSRKSPSLPPLTPSLSPERETEPTQPRNPSLSPNLFDWLSNYDPNEDRTPSPPPRLSGRTVSSPPPPITPVPDYVLHNHKQICGRNPSQFAAIPSPWRKKPSKDPLPPINPPTGQNEIPKDTVEEIGEKVGKKRKHVNEVSKKDEIDRRVWSKAHEERHKTPPSNGKPKQEKKLVDLSSSSSSGPPSDPPIGNNNGILVNVISSDPSLIKTPSKKKIKLGEMHQVRKALSPLNKNNAMRGAISSSNIGMNKGIPGTRISPLPIPRKSPITTTTPRRRAKKGLPISPLPRTSIMQRESQRRAERERSMSPSPIKSNSKAFPRLSGKSPSPERFFAESRRLVEERQMDKLESLSKVNRQHRKSLSQQQQQQQAESSSPHQPLTPQKASPKKHYQITPPKSRSTSHPRPRLSERQETLFVLPDPPPQPNFPNLSNRRNDDNIGGGPREWKVAEMEPETLLDWGLDSDSQAEDGDDADAYDNNAVGDDGGGDAPHEIGDHENAKERESERDQQQRNESQTPEPPLFSPSGSPRINEGRRPSIGERWSSKSIEPTALSQDFPRLFPSSPSLDGRKSPLRSSPPPLPPPPQLLAPSPKSKRQIPTSSKDKSAAPQPVPGGSTSRSKWDHLQHGILASTPSVTKAKPIPSSSQKRAGTTSTPTSSQKGKKRKSRPTVEEREQSKLASFGFFNDKPPKKLKRDFESKWEDEVDLEIPEDEQISSSSPSNRNGEGEGKGGKRLGKVPEPPHHPSLRAAGIRELEKRQVSQDNLRTPKAKVKDTNLPSSSPEPEPPLFELDHSLFNTTNSHTSSSQTSSSTTTNHRTPGSTKDWWDGLGNRRSSEFGTME